MLSRLSVVVCCLSVTATAQLSDPLGEECFGVIHGLFVGGICSLNRVTCDPSTHAAMQISEVYTQDGGCQRFGHYCCVALPAENEECFFDWDYIAGTTRGLCRERATCLAENPSDIGENPTQYEIGIKEPFCLEGLVCCIHDNLPP